MVPPKIVQQNSKQMHVAVFDLPHLDEGVVNLLNDLCMCESSATLSAIPKDQSSTDRWVLPMQLAHKLEHAVARIARQRVVKQMADIQLHWSPFFRNHDWPVGRVALIVRVVQHGNLPLIQVHGGLLALDCLEDRPHLFVSRFRPQQETTAAFQRRAQVVNVGSRKIVKEHSENVKDDVDRSHPELCQFGQEPEILHDQEKG